jgi:hypothetical protein
MGQRVSREVVAEVPRAPSVDINLGFVYVLKGGTETPCTDAPCIKKPLDHDAAHEFAAQLGARTADVKRATAEVAAAQQALDALARPGTDLAAALCARTALDEAKTRLDAAVEAQSAACIERVVAAAKAAVLAYAGMAVAHGCEHVTVLVVVPESVSVSIYNLERVWHAQTLAPEVRADEVHGSTHLWGGNNYTVDGGRTIALTASITHGDGGELLVWDRATSELLMGEAYIAEHRRRVGFN